MAVGVKSTGDSDVLKEPVGALERQHNPLMTAVPPLGLRCQFLTAIQCRPFRHRKAVGKQHWGPLAGPPYPLALRNWACEAPMMPP